jgi:hypothetical protein
MKRISSIRSVSSGNISVLLAKTLRSRTFRLALICIIAFGAIVLALFGYVYSSTVFYVHGRSDQAIAAEHATLEPAYTNVGRAGLIIAITQHIADRRFNGGVYLLVDASSDRLAGNLDSWPAALTGASGIGDFSAPDPNAGATRERLFRANF